MKNNMIKIPYGLNVYGKEEINAVLKTLKKSTQMGKAVNDFELKISKLFSKKYGLMVNSGSSALLLALKVMNFKKGSEIIAPCLNFGTAISSITLSNLIPIFVDCKKIRQIANKYKLLVIEDSADTLGATVNAKPSGIFSDISITSFYGSHIISCAGNGGMLLTNNKNFHTRAKVLRSWGRMSTLIKDSENIKKRLGIKLKGFDYDKKFVFSESGYNFEPSEIGASFGLVQLKKFKKFNMQRNKNFLLHSNFFKKFKDYFIIPKIEKSVKTNFLAYPIILKNNLHFSRKDLQVYLEKHKIQTRPIFTGNTLRHPGFSNLISKRNKLQSFKNSDYIMKYGLLIGCHQGLGVNDISYIHKKILAFIN
jgi:CDP-6-deoxy-D-xylo-4-hexulose-3-dehydrase